MLDTLTPAEVRARLAAPAPERAGFLRAAAEEGHAEAQTVYAQMLLDGDGVPADHRAAFGWFGRAAAQRHLLALNMVGRCYDGGWGTRIDKARAAECFCAAAEAGMVEAMYNYATLLALGEGVAEDRVAALGWLERAAALGFAKAVNFIGSFAEDGWAGPRDMARAADCYLRAAEGGDFRGAFNHARMLADRGEVEAALGWLAKAAAWGNPAFRAKAAGWLRRSPVARFRSEGVETMERAC